MTPFIENKTESDPTEISVLKNRKDFLRIASGKIKWVSGSMIVQEAKMPLNEGRTPSSIRIGYTASKKVGNAVKRVRAKRRLREVIRQVLPNLGKKGHDYVVIARSVTLDVSFEQLIRDFSWCLKRLNQNNNQNNLPLNLDNEPKKPHSAPSGRTNK